MAKIDVKLDKQFLSELTGSLNKSAFEGDKRLLSLFDLINNHEKDDTIDVKEITDFANSIFSADKNNDGEVDKTELEMYVKNNEDKFKESKIKTKDILEFLNIFRTNSDKTDEKNQRITNDDGSYSLIYQEIKIEKIKTKSRNSKNENTTKDFFTNFKNLRKYTVSIKQNYGPDGNLLNTEETNGNKTRITDANGKFITEQTKNKGKIVSETKADGLMYYYEDKKAVIKKDNMLVKEIITLDNGQVIAKKYDNSFGKQTITTTNETTGDVTKKTIYSDNYYLQIENVGGTRVGGLKDLINKPLSANTLSTFLYNDKNIINAIAQEDDENFQKTYITGMVNKIIEIAELIGENSDEVKAIQKEIQEKGFENVPIEKINSSYSKLFSRIEKQNFDFSDSCINNANYKSKKSYTEIITGNIIVVIDNETNQKTKINLSNLLSPFNKSYKQQIIESIKEIPAEVLLDLATEVTFTNGFVGEGADGFFNLEQDRIALSGGSCNPKTIIHELGHAIDCIGKGSIDNDQTEHNKKFLQIFRDEMRTFEQAGNKRCKAYYDENGKYQVYNDIFTSATGGNNSLYATTNKQEMFAECYVLLMYGSCQSQEVIDKYFPNTRDCVLEMVESTRKLPKSRRHIAK